MQHDTYDLPSLPELSDDEIAEFQRILREETGDALTSGEARLRASELIRLVTMLARPPEAKPAGSSSSPASLLESWDRILGRLRALSQSLVDIRHQSKDWVWPVREAQDLFREVFVFRIHQALDRTSGQPPALDPLIQPLPELVDALRDQTRPDLPLRTTRVAVQIERLNREAALMTTAGWDVLGTVLPQLFLDLVLVCRVLLLLTKIICPAEYGQAITRELDSLDRRLLILQEEGKAYAVKKPAR